MNMNQHFDNHIKTQFEDYTPQVHPRIWENIMKEREKKRPAGFWWQLFNRRNILLLAGLFAATTGGTYLLVNKNENIAAQKNNSTIAATTNKTDAATNNTETVTSTGTTAENTTAAPVNNAANNADYTASNNTGSTPNNGSLKNSTAKQNNAAIRNTNNNAVNNRAVIQTTAAKQRIKIKNGVAFFDDDTDDAIASTATPYSLPFLFYTAQKNSAAKATASLGKRNLANVVDPGCPSIEKNAAGNKTYVEIYGGPDYAFKNLSDTGNSVYLQKRKESTKFSSAFSVGMRYTKVFSNGVSIRTGINYSQINEKFIYSEGNIIQVVYIINANGDTIGSYTNTGSRYKTTHNKFRTIDVPLVLGYEMGNGKLHTNINAGVIVNAYSWQKGEVLDANLRPVNITTGKSTSPYQFKTNIGVGFIGSVSFYYKLNEKLHLLAEPYFRYNLTAASKEELTFKQKYNTAGLRLGLRLDLK